MTRGGRSTLARELEETTSASVFPSLSLRWLASIQVLDFAIDSERDGTAEGAHSGLNDV